MEFSRKKRFVIGLAILLVVDIIWVASSELTKFIFNDSGFNKPFFSTYLKTTLFSLYLLGFLFRKSWRAQCVIAEEDHLYEVVNTSPDEDCISQESSSLGESSFEPLKYGEIDKSVDSDDSANKSVRFSKLTEVRHLSESEASEAMFSRLSFSASLRAEQLALDLADKFSIKVVMKISLIFCLLWFLANYGYQKALSVSEVGIVNIISSTSSLFTLILAAVFPSSSSDKFTFSKLVAVLFMVAGITVISLEDINLEQSSVPLGVIWSLVGAVLYASYMVFIRRKVPSEGKLDFTMFLGFVGLFNALILWPGFVLFSVVGWETFQIPTKRQVVYMVVNGLIGTVLSELLWLWGCFLTSSLMATLSISLTIPLSMLCDKLLKGVSYSWHFYAGATPVFVSFVAVTLLTHFEDSDPLLDGFKYLAKLCCRQKQRYKLIVADSTEQEELIGNGDPESYMNGDIEELENDISK